MSDLTAQQWSEMTVKKLRVMENQCEDIDLFCVGYLIPQVELLEVEQSTSIATQAQWQHWFGGFVEQCLEQDNVNEEDVFRIRNLITSLGA